MIGTPRELLQMIEMTWRQSTEFSEKANDCIANGLMQLRALLNAPEAETGPATESEGDVMYAIIFDDQDVRHETVIGAKVARQRYQDISMNWNAHLFVKLDSNSRDGLYSNANYRDVKVGNYWQGQYHTMARAHLNQTFSLAKLEDQYEQLRMAAKNAMPDLPTPMRAKLRERLNELSENKKIGQ
ncbi:hypothetical protein RYA05_03410 [Pseudomonas syringae pv. actinidiae]|nr:hypothetical protein [Pseudomonas syringae pv. actinidiae]